MKEIVLYNNNNNDNNSNINFENINKNESVIISEENYENKLNGNNQSNNYKIKSSNSFHTASSTASMKGSRKKKKKKDNCNKNETLNNAEEHLSENEIDLSKNNNLEKRSFSLDKKKGSSEKNKRSILSNNKSILKKIGCKDDMNFISKKMKSFNFQNSLEEKMKDTTNKIVADGLKTIQSDILDLKVGNITYNKKKEKNLIIDSLNTIEGKEMKKENIILQYEKYKRKKKRKKRIKSGLFKKSVCYSNFISPDIINLLNQTKLNLTFYQREVDDFLNVIRNLQNIVLIEREKYNELKEMLKYTTEEIEKENNKLYEELSMYKNKYYKLKNIISSIGYGIFFNIDNKEMNHKYSNKENSYINYEKLYVSEDNENEERNEYDYVMIDNKLNCSNNNYYNKYIKKSKNNNHTSLLNYLDF